MGNQILEKARRRIGGESDKNHVNSVEKITKTSDGAANVVEKDVKESDSKIRSEE